MNEEGGDLALRFHELGVRGIQTDQSMKEAEREQKRREKEAEKEQKEAIRNSLKQNKGPGLLDRILGRKSGS
jgi:hypothetical protein